MDRLLENAEPVITSETIGWGTFACVKKAYRNERPCAVKMLQEDQRKNPKARKRFQIECQLLPQLKHPHIVGCYGVANHDGEAVLLLELLTQNLRTFLKKKVPFHDKVDICIDIAQGIHYLHSLCPAIIHRDLSDGNILISPCNRAKISDFGMAREIDPERTPVPSELTPDPGCSPYMPPEARRYSPRYGLGIDIFASGVLILQIRVQKPPSPSAEEVLEKLHLASAKPSSKIVPEVQRRSEHIEMLPPNDPFLPIISQCLEDAQEKRPTAKQLCLQLQEIKFTEEYAHSSIVEASTEDKLFQLKEGLESTKEQQANVESNMKSEISRLMAELEASKEDLMKVKESMESEVSRLATELAAAKEDHAQMQKSMESNVSRLSTELTAARKDHAKSQKSVESEISKLSTELVAVKGKYANVKKSLESDVSQLRAEVHQSRSATIQATAPTPTDRAKHQPARHQPVVHYSSNLRTRGSRLSAGYCSLSSQADDSSISDGHSLFASQETTHGLRDNSYSFPQPRLTSQLSRSSWGMQPAACPVILLGPWKDEVEYMLISNYPEEFRCCISYTNAPSRTREGDGCRCVSLMEMKRLIQEGFFAHIVGSERQYYYGISYEEIYKHLHEGFHCILPGSIELASDLKRRHTCSIVICIFPSPEVIDSEWLEKLQRSNHISVYDVCGDSIRDICSKVKAIIDQYR